MLFSVNEALSRLASIAGCLSCTSLSKEAACLQDVHKTGPPAEYRGEELSQHEKHYPLSEQAHDTIKQYILNWGDLPKLCLLDSFSDDQRNI